MLLSHWPAYSARARTWRGSKRNGTPDTRMTTGACLPALGSQLRRRVSSSARLWHRNSYNLSPFVYLVQDPCIRVGIYGQHHRFVPFSDMYAHVRYVGLIWRDTRQILRFRATHRETSFIVFCRDYDSLLCTFLSCLLRLLEWNFNINCKRYGKWPLWCL